MAEFDKTEYVVPVFQQPTTRTTVRTYGTLIWYMQAHAMRQWKMSATEKRKIAAMAI